MITYDENLYIDNDATTRDAFSDRLNEVFGIDANVFVTDGDHLAHAPDSDDQITIVAGSRPIDSTAELMLSRIHTGNDALGSFRLYTADQALTSGWFPVEIENARGDDPVTIAVFNPDLRQWHMPAPITSLILLGGHYMLDLDALFGDFACSLNDDEWAVTRVAEIEANRMAAFQEFITTTHTQPVENLETQISNAVTELTQQHDYLTEIETRLASYQRELDQAIEAANTPTDVVAERELAAIQRHALVDSVEIVSGYKLKVYTKNIMLPDPHGTEDDAILGEYEITLDFAMNSALPRNMTNRKGEYDHPHVHNQSFCSGTWSSTIRDLISQRKIAAAVSFVIDTLEHCNPEDDWGRSYRHWFVEGNNEMALERSVRS
jgi:hypothetical protein